MASNPSQSSSSSPSSTSAQHELSPMEDPRSPFFLHHGEAPGAILVSQSLIEDNYSTWARAMWMALDAKSKLGFVDGSITASMAITPLEKLTWSKNNSMISSWILNSISPHITASVIYKDTALEVWNAPRNRFSQANGPRISQLQKQISMVMQGDSTVTSFFTGLQTAWVSYWISGLCRVVLMVNVPVELMTKLHLFNIKIRWCNSSMDWWCLFTSQNSNLDDGAHSFSW